MIIKNDYERSLIHAALKYYYISCASVLNEDDAKTIKKLIEDTNCEVINDAY